MKHDSNSIRAACKAVGSQAELARRIDVKPPTVNQWVQGDRPVPAALCKKIVSACDGAVTLKDLRPRDAHLIWPEEVNAA